ncbi:GTP cyclohydrolase II RibA [Streptomyces sp. NPDC002588]|uniref:GTP cyclohydrolase II RibA n=1 Tax=Streptomyces sp. NPDC002588 TaxID=3154419 RepID=UPI00331EFFE4
MNPLTTLPHTASVRARVPITLDRAAGRPAELVTFHHLPDAQEHVACVLPYAPRSVPLVRLHSECLTGDVFGSARCDCGPQLDEALTAMAAEGGVLLYLRQEGRGIGLYNKLDTYVLQDQDIDTFRANRIIGRGEDERDYRAAAAMLRALGLTRVRLLTNNPDKVAQLRGLGIRVDAVLPTAVHLTPHNERYLSAKAKSGHTLALLKEASA